jgi:peroxiredoxin
MDDRAADFLDGLAAQLAMEQLALSGRSKRWETIANPTVPKMGS